MFHGSVVYFCGPAYFFQNLRCKGNVAPFAAVVWSHHATRPLLNGERARCLTRPINGREKDYNVSRLKELQIDLAA